MLVHSPRWLAALVGWVLCGCEPQFGRAGPEELGGGIEPWGDTTDPDETDETDSQGTDTDGSEDEARLASGIGLASIEANQGVSVPLVRLGEGVSVGDRRAPLIEGRKTLVRAHWILADDWVPREIEAELVLMHGGERHQFVQRRFIDGSSIPEVIGGAFDWLLPAAVLRTGMRYSVVLREVDGPGGPTEGLSPRFPAEGLANMGVEGGPRELEIVFVPAHVAGTEIRLTEAGKAEVEALLMATSPVQSVHVSWHAPVIEDDWLESVDDAWDLLDEVRTADGALPHVYYHLLLHRDGCCNLEEFTFNGVGGIPGPGMTAVEAEARSALILSRDGTPEVAVNTIVHELGHNQGRSHAPCGGAGSPDPHFPYADASIGVQGFDIVAEQLIAPESPDAGGAADFMGYCWPSWYSDYHWGLNAERARALSKASSERSEPGRVLRAIAHADGRALRWVEREGGWTQVADLGETLGRARLWAADGEWEDVPLATVPLSEGGLSLVLAPVPAGLVPVRAEVMAGPMAGRESTSIRRRPRELLRMGR